MASDRPDAPAAPVDLEALRTKVRTRTLWTWAEMDTALDELAALRELKVALAADPSDRGTIARACLAAGRGMERASREIAHFDATETGKLVNESAQMVIDDLAEDNDRAHKRIADLESELAARRAQGTLAAWASREDDTIIARLQRLDAIEAAAREARDRIELVASDERLAPEIADALDMLTAALAGAEPGKEPSTSDPPTA